MRWLPIYPRLSRSSGDAELCERQSRSQYAQKQSQNRFPKESETTRGVSVARDAARKAGARRLSKHLVKPMKLAKLKFAMIPQWLRREAFEPTGSSGDAHEN